MKLVVTRNLPGLPVEDLRAAYSNVEIFDKGRPLMPGELQGALKDADVVICLLTDRIGPEISSTLKCVITYSVGVDHLNVTGLRAKGIRIAHTPDVLTQATANLAWSLILGTSRRVGPARDWLLKNGMQGFGPDFFLGQGLEGGTLGILGMGRIGSAVAARAKPFGLNVVYHNRKKLKNEESLGASYVDFETLLKCDVVSLHCPLTPETHHLFDAKTFAKMKKRCLLINTARGPLIDEKALVQHLKNEREFYAGLDVFEREPESQRAY